MDTHCHFIPNTHLDREWTLDFQHTRKMTVDFIDDLLEIMDKVDNYSFLLDSQAVPLEDYLEVHPEKKDKLKEHISSGRIAAGPWYSALDMNCISGEAIIRNMLYGHTTVEPFGPVMKVGYTPFGWGQCSQLPQIYKGFGVNVAFFYRGITQEQTPKAEFTWEGADGTELLTSRFGTGARYNFYFDVWRKALYTNHPHRVARRTHWLEDAAPFKLCDSHHRYVHGYVLPVEREMDGNKARECYRKLVEDEKEHFSTKHIALMHGMDTSTPDMREMEILKLCQEDLGDDEKFFLSSMPQYAEAIYEELKDAKDLPRVTGEARHVKMNDLGFSFIANDIISARTRQKAFLMEVENTLTRQAEPFAFMAALNGTPWPAPYIDIAWRQLLKCHPHDTIGGCGIDRLEEDAMYRLKDTLSSANVVSSESLMAIQKQIDTSSINEKAVILTVYNPSAFDRSDVVEAYVDVPCELAVNFEAGDVPPAVDWTNLTLKDHAGNTVPHSIQGTDYHGKVFRDHADLALMSYADEHRIRFKTDNVPALGYKTYVLTVEENAEAKTATPDDLSFENEYMTASVNSDGTVDIQDKQSGEKYNSLNYFEDGGAVGHAWTFIQPNKDLLISSKGEKASISIIENSAVTKVIRAEITLKVPAHTPRTTDRMDWRKTERKAEDLRDLTLQVDYTLRSGQRYLECAVSFDNPAKNHRLRAMFPSDVASEDSFAESPFDVVTRRIPKDDKNDYSYNPHLTYPMIRFAGLKGGKRSLAIISGGLKEYEVSTDDSRTLALTLHRGFDNNMCTSGDFDLEHSPGELCQGIGKHSYRYALFTSDTGAHYQDLFRQADHFHAPMVVAETKARKGSLPMEGGFLSIDNPTVQLSGLKGASRSDKLIARIYNPSPETQKTIVTLGKTATSAELCNLNEEQGEALEITGNKIAIELPPKKIATLALNT